MEYFARPQDAIGRKYRLPTLEVRKTYSLGMSVVAATGGSELDARHQPCRTCKIWHEIDISSRSDDQIAGADGIGNWNRQRQANWLISRRPGFALR